MKQYIHLLALILLTTSCVFKNSNKNTVPLKSTDFNKTINGKDVSLFQFKNGNIQLAVTNYGARIVSLITPDKNNKEADIVLGFKNIDDYLSAKAVYHGAIIGRVANRIANGKFKIDGSAYQLPQNNGTNHLHGGAQGFHNQVWDVKEISDTSIVLSYLSIDNEMGYPGNLNVEVKYAVSSTNQLIIEYKAKTDKTTLFNPTNHSFFNLAGEGNGSIKDHLLRINADYFTAIDSNNLPLKDRNVENTPFNFKIEKAIGRQLQQIESNIQLKRGHGYDHNFILKKQINNSIAATVIHPQSGRKMEVYTTAPCIQFFTSNFFDGSDIGKCGKQFLARESFALETQCYPDAPNQKNAKSITLNPDQEFRSKTVYQFSVINK